MLFDWGTSWPLSLDVCPCDQHFLDWIEERNLSDKVVFHMGTGAHHLIGKTLAEKNKNFLVHAITASPAEYDEFMKFTISNANIGWNYKPFFGDIYQTDKRQYHSLDIVNLFHLCEFTNEICNQGFGLSDEEVARIFLDFLKPGGLILTYKSSFGFEKTDKIFQQLKDENLIVHNEDFKKLRVWTKL